MVRPLLVLLVPLGRFYFNYYYHRRRLFYCFECIVWLKRHTMTIVGDNRLAGYVMKLLLDETAANS